MCPVERMILKQFVWRRRNDLHLFDNLISSVMSKLQLPVSPLLGTPLTEDELKSILGGKTRRVCECHISYQVRVMDCVSGCTCSENHGDTGCGCTSRMETQTDYLSFTSSTCQSCEAACREKAKRISPDASFTYSFHEYA